MPLYNVFQNRSIAKHGEQVNAMDWDKACQKFPGIKVHLDCSLSGSRKWIPEYKPFYSHVLEVEADSLDDLFALTNGVPRDGARIVKEVQSWHSLSVGDIVEVGREHFMVDPIGFTRIEMP